MSSSLGLACCAPASKGKVTIPPMVTAAITPAIKWCRFRLVDGLELVFM